MVPFQASGVHCLSLQSLVFAVCTTFKLAINHTVCTMLSSNQFVRVFVLDLSKAFDSIRHNQLFAKLSALSISLRDGIYNWITHFFTEQGHCTKFAEISASVVQGSGLGPASPQVICNQVTTVMKSSSMLTTHI